MHETVDAGATRRLGVCTAAAAKHTARATRAGDQYCGERQCQYGGESRCQYGWERRCQLTAPANATTSPTLHRVPLVPTLHFAPKSARTEPLPRTPSDESSPSPDRPTTTKPLLQAARMEDRALKAEAQLAATEQLLAATEGQLAALRSRMSNPNQGSGLPPPPPPPSGQPPQFGVGVEAGGLAVVRGAQDECRATGGAGAGGQCEGSYDRERHLNEGGSRAVYNF